MSTFAVDMVDDDIEQQRELFLWKFKDITREIINVELADFKKHDLKGVGELDEHEALMFLEHRGLAKTAMELRALLTDIDKDKNHKVNFLEWCCFHFEKPYEELNNFTDEAARQAALAEMRAAGESAKKAEAAIIAAKEAEEAAATKRAEELEAEAKLTGVKGAAAFFKRQAESTGDNTMTNKEKIQAESQRRRDLREAKKREEAAASEASKTKSAEEVAAEIEAATEKARADEVAEKAAAAAKEKADRIARKKAMNERFAATK